MKKPVAAGPDPTLEVRADDERLAVRAFDEFDGKLNLLWRLVRHDPTHVSLTKHPGKLTIVTQRGFICGDEERVPPGERIRAKNIFLIEDPLPEEPGFVVTTQLDSFEPTMHFHQAGLILYDDDDNFLKWVYAFSSRRRVLSLNREKNKNLQITHVPVEQELKRLWLCLTKRGDHYEFASSADGRTFTAHGELPWGDGPPQRIGLVAKNGGRPEARELDACFEFFEVRPLTRTERNDPRYVERQKLEGTWEVVSCQSDGKPLQTAPFSRFAFHSGQLTVTEGTRSIQTEFALAVTKEPPQLVLSALAGRRTQAVRAVYSLQQNVLMLCFDLRPGAPVPDKLETKQGDGRTLVTLKRVREEE